MDYQLQIKRMNEGTIYLAELLNPHFNQAAYFSQLSEEELLMLASRKSEAKKIEFIFSRILIKKIAALPKVQHHLYTVKYCSALKCTAIFKNNSLIKQLSLSHSKQFVAFTFYHEQNSLAPTAGIDIEAITQRNIKSLVEEYFCSQDQITILNSTSPLDNFYLFWTKKEAVAKLTNTSVLMLLNTSHKTLEQTYNFEHIITNEYVCTLAYYRNT